MADKRAYENFFDNNNSNRMRTGRIGSSWRHIKQTNNYSGSNLLFIDGSVRIDDAERFPSKKMAHIEKSKELDDSLVGLTTQSLNDLNLPLYKQVRTRQFSYKPHDNKFHLHAKQGFQYWPLDQQKNKAKTIGIGHPYFKSGF